MKKLLFFFFCFLLMACNPSQTALDDLESFTNRMEQKSGSWSEADWDDAAQHYDEITQTLQRYEYSDEELRYIGTLEGRCMAYFLAHYASTATDRAHDALMEIGGAVEGFLNAFGMDTSDEEETIQP